MEWPRASVWGAPGARMTPLRGVPLPPRLWRQWRQWPAGALGPTLTALLLLLLGLSSPGAALARNLEQPRYDTAYACEGKTLTIACRPGEQIHLIRANYGRFSITICNDHGNTEWSVNCMSPKSLRVLHNKCSEQQNCSVAAHTSMFGDPCPGTLKYLEAHYQCTPVSSVASTPRASPPWLITSQPSVWSTAKLPPGLLKPAAPPQPPPQTAAGPTPQPAPAPAPAPAGSDQGQEEQAGSSQTAPATQTTGRPAAAPAPQPQPQPPQQQPPQERDRDRDREEETALEPAPATPPAPSPAPGPAHAPGSGYGRDPGNEPPPAGAGDQHPSPSSTPATSTASIDASLSSSNPWFQGELSLCSPLTARGLYWNWTRAGEVAVQACPGGATGVAKWRCSPSSMWEPETPDLSECRSVWLTSLESRVQEGDSLISIANDLSQVTSSKTLYGGDMMTTTKIMKAMAEKLAKDSQTFPDPQQREAIVTELLHGAVRTGSNLLDIAHMPSWHDLSYREQMLVATSLLIGLEENAFLVADAVMTEKTVIQSFKNILLSVRVLENRSIGLTEQFPTAAALKTWDGRLVSDGDWLELPRGALLDNSDKGLVRLVFVAFDRLEEILQPKGDPVENSAGVISNVTRVINSKIISASLGKGHHIQLSEPVRLTLKHIRTENVSNPSCVFWDYLMSSWSEEGCRVRSNNQTHTVCECEHLTNFAVLMDVHSTLLPQVHQAALQVITYVGCVISVVCLVLAILTFQLFRGLKSDRTTIHKNLCICLLLGELLFLAGIGRTDTPILCGVVAGLLHFFFLCAFAWMFLEGFQLYVMLIEVFEAEKSRVRWYYLFAYGAPLVVVAISSVVDPFSYGTEQYCWLRADNFFIFSFVGPVIAVILANLVFLAMAIFMMCRHASSAVAMKSKEHSRLASAKAWLRGAIVLVFLLGLTWTFGLLYLNEQTVVMAYIFTILNSLQGLFIFIFHCVQNEKVRKEYRKFVRRHSWLPKCLRCSKSSSNGSKERRSSLYTASNGNPSAPNTHSSSVGGGSDNAANSFLQQGWNSRSLRSSGKGLGNSTSNTVVVGQVTHMPAHTPIPVHGTTIENGGLGGSALGGPVLVNDMDPNGSVRTAASPLENRVSTLPYSRSNSRGHLPKSSSSWGSLHKNMSPKNYSREQLRHQHLEHVMSSPPNHYNGHHVHGHGHGPHDVIGHAEDVASAASAMGRMSSLRSGSSSRRAHSPWNHTYTEIRERERERERERAMRCGMDRGMDDPVYEEIERGGEVHASDFSDDDGRRQSDMSRQSSRSYGDHRPLIPYSPGAGTGTGATAPLRYVPSVPNQCDIARTVAVLDGDTVVCHLQPDHSLYPQRTLGPYNECYSLQ